MKRTAMAEQADRICRLAQQSAAAGDADSALQGLTELRGEVDALIRLNVGRALAAGQSFSDVARALGISRQAAHRRFRDLAPARPRRRRRPLVATGAARRVMRLAAAEARAAGASPGSEHVLLGVLRTDSDATRALRFEGVTAERARACVPTTTDEARATGDSTSMTRILKRAAQLALSRDDGDLDLDHLLLAALTDPDGRARQMLTALAVEPSSVRTRLSPEPRSLRTSSNLDIAR